MKGNVNNFDPKINELLKEDNKHVADEGFSSNKNMEEKKLNKRSHVLQHQKSRKPFYKEHEKKSNKVWVVKIR